MKRATFINVLLYIYIIVFCSCTYDYNMPNFTNVRAQYSIVGFSTDFKAELREIAIKYGLDLSISQEKWEIWVCEKDENGNILYEGLSRSYADIAACSLNLYIKCLGRVNPYDNQYYEICTFVFDTEYSLKKTPTSCEIEISRNDTYVIKEPADSERVYNYKLTYTGVLGLLDDEIDALGYEIADVKTLLIEKDSDGNVLSEKYKPSGDNTLYSTKGAQTLEVRIEVYGWPKGLNDPKALLGILKFNEDFDLKSLNNQTLVLTTEIPHSFEIVLPDSERVYNYKITYDYSILASVNKKMEEVGYESAGVEMLLIEKDRYGNVLSERYKPSGDNILYSSKGAEILEVRIEVYGRIKSAHKEVKVATLVFKEEFQLKELNNKKTILNSANYYIVEWSI